VKVAFGSHALGLLRLIDCTDARSVHEFTPLIWFGASSCNVNLKINSVSRFDLRVSYEDYHLGYCRDVCIRNFYVFFFIAFHTFIINYGDLYL
jgi:hypothetical protein